MDLTFDITLLGIIVLAVASIVYGVALAFVGDVRTGYEWVGTAIAAFIGSFVASEYLTMQSFQPVWEGIALVPALVGGLAVGLVVDLLMRYSTGGSLTHGTRPV